MTEENSTQEATKNVAQPPAKKFPIVGVIVGVVVVLALGIGLLLNNVFNTAKGALTKNISDGQGNTVNLGGLIKAVGDAAKSDSQNSNSSGSSASVDFKLGDLLKGSLPNGFPQNEVPIISNSSVINGAKNTNNSRVSYDVTLSVDKSKYNPQQAFEFYNTELPKKGWTISNTSEGGFGNTITASKTGWSLSVTTSDYFLSTQETLVSINLDEEK
jgi:hypothetical protein